MRRISAASHSVLVSVIRPSSSAPTSADRSCSRLSTRTVIASRSPADMASMKSVCRIHTCDEARTRVALSGDPLFSASARKHSQMNRVPTR